ncbi:acyltransferase family protein [Paenibacillus yonginensis]|uniref:acyltransferase family protein n=1 Tax=Paenibacillus yonginensis TaxID=1462996 RepID=UPI001F01C05E|nr:acyltransferase family protein [Paenibacillus yonginensis]
MKRTEDFKAQDVSSDRFLLPKRRYMTGLDGLRALAILAVLIYHLRQEWLPGGFLGVAVFFTLSGYLITDILANGKAAEDGGGTLRLSLKEFWIRRARRLLPAMLIVVSAVVAGAWLGASSPLPELRGDVPAALLYISNWWFIFHKVSYFESFGPPSPLGHLWSLAVEEQFYIVWPIMLAAGLKWIRSRISLAGWVLGLAAVSAALMAFLYEQGTDPSRVYYGTDTRGFALLIGAALALVWPSGKLKLQVSRRASLLLDSAGMISLVLLGFWTYNSDPYDDFLYRGGLFGIAFVSAVLIAVLAHPGSRIGGWFSARPLVWVGRRAYGLYLWHYPVMMLTTPQLDSGGSHWLRLFLQLLATFLLAAASYRWVEDPIRQSGFRGWLAGLSTTMNVWGRWKRLPAASLLFILFLVLFSFIHLYLPPTLLGSTDASGKSGSSTTVLPVFQNKPEQTGSHEGKAPSETGPTVPTSQQTTGGEGAGTETALPPTVDGHSPEGSQTAENSSAVQSSEEHSSEAGRPQEDTSDQLQAPQSANQPDDSAKPSNGKPSKENPHGTGGDITAIGDSVMLDIEGDLQKMYPDAVIDGKIGRQMADVPAVLQRLAEEGRLRETVVLELGTNGAFSNKQMKKVLAALKDAKRILLVNTRVPRPWESAVNQALDKISSTDDRIQIVDWYQASGGQTSYFEQDGVHLKPEGAAAYTLLLNQALSDK